MNKPEAIAKLIEAGAVHEKKEDAQGVTRSGWWMDSVWLAPYQKPFDALKAING